MRDAPQPCEVCGATEGVFHSVAGWLCDDIHGCYERRVAQSEKYSDIRECKIVAAPAEACEPCDEVDLGEEVELREEVGRGADEGAAELPTLSCPRCHPESLGGVGVIFQDARGGFECTKCDARFLIARQPPLGYGGPGGRLAWWELHGATLQRWSDGAAGAGGVALVVWTAAGVVLLALSVLLRFAASGFRYREVFRA